MSQHEPSLTQDTIGALVRMHRVARGLTQQALARLCQLSPIYISQIEQGVRIPSVTACRALAAALGCTSRLLMLQVFRATAPTEIQDVLHEEDVTVSDTPTMQEFMPLLRTVQTLPPTTRHQLLQLWQASLALVKGRSSPHPSANQASDADAEHYATTPYY